MKALTTIMILAGAGLLAAFSFAHHKPGHNGGPGGDGDPERIPGCATFAPNPITTDGLGTYCDGDPTTNYQNQNDTMQVAMNCQFNHFNLDPGGGARRIFVAVPIAFDTGITSCKDGNGDPVDVDFLDTSMSNVDDCDTNDPDWAFLQLMRSADPSTDLCNLEAGDAPATANLRLQTHLQHQKMCNGGARKCGVSFEAIDIRYGVEGSCPQIEIACIAPASGPCTTWTVSTTGDGTACVTNESDTAPANIDLPFSVTFVSN